jgi:hypothetical protein
MMCSLECDIFYTMDIYTSAFMIVMVIALFTLNLKE